MFIWQESFQGYNLVNNMAPYPPCESRNSASEVKRGPELLGVSEKEACHVIENWNSNVKTILLLPGDYRLDDFCVNRVYVSVDKPGGVVINIPVLG